MAAFACSWGAAWSDTVQPEHTDVVEPCAYTGAGHRGLAEAGVLDVLPSHYSTFGAVLGYGPMKVDVLLVQVAPGSPGQYSLSIAHEYLVPLIDSARVVIAEVNDQAPWTHGARVLTDADIDVAVHASRPPIESRRAAPSDTDRAIARHVAALIEDGATLQLGLGGLPDAVLSALAGHRDLGVHSGAIGDGVAELMARGVITNARKPFDRGQTVAGVLMGTRRIYDFADRNPAIQMRATAYTHDLDVLAAIDRFVALNAVLEVDLTGQINAEAVGGRYVGAVGGALDFLRGAHRSRGGLPIVALPSRTTGVRPASRIVAQLNGPVSTPRSDTSIVVTEFGVADLRGLTLRQRVRRMLDIAHPDERAALERAAPPC